MFSFVEWSVFMYLYRRRADVVRQVDGDTIVTIAVFGTTLEKFTVGNAILVFASTGSIVFIWLDYILRTQFLRS